MFVYRFADPGAYVFSLSSDVNKKIVSTFELNYSQIYIRDIET